MSETRNQNDEDQIAQLIELAQIPQSQQLILRSSSFDFKIDADDSDDESSEVVCWMPDEAAVGITMVSPPESSEDDEIESTRDDQFQTPPENLVSSSQEQRSGASGRIGGGGRGIGGSGGGDGESICVDDDRAIIEGMVDLCKDTILGFSKVQTKYANLKEHLNTTVNHRHSDDGVVTGRDDTERVVDLGGDNADTELSEESDDGDEQNDDTACKIPPQRFILNNEYLKPGHEFTEGSDDDEQNAGISDETASKKVIRVSENLKPYLEISKGSGDAAPNEDVSAESISKRMKLSNERLTNPESSRATVELNKESSSAVKDIEDIEKFNYVGTSGTDPLGKRKLPASLVGQVEKASEEAPVGEETHMGEEVFPGSSKSPPRGTQASVDCLLNVLKALAMRSEPKKVEPGNLMEIAMRRGLKFPTPFWPPPEGHEKD